MTPHNIDHFLFLFTHKKNLDVTAIWEDARQF